MILPFIEQQSLYETIDMRLPIWGQTVVSTNVPTLRCPSDQRQTVDLTSNIAVTNYPGTEGYHWHPTADITNAAPWNTFGDPFGDNCSLNGVFTVTRTAKMSHVTDGTSNTIIFSEADSMGYGGGAIRTLGTGLRRTGTPVFHSAFVGTASNGWGANETAVNVGKSRWFSQDQWHLVPQSRLHADLHCSVWPAFLLAGPVELSPGWTPNRDGRWERRLHHHGHGLRDVGEAECDGRQASNEEFQVIIEGRCLVRTLLTLLVLVSELGMDGGGCGKHDPRDSPNFDKAAYDDVNASSKALSEDKAVSH